MTILEKITRDPAWRGCAVEPATHNGRPAWKITRDNAVAFVYQEAAQVQVRHWDAYLAAREAATSGGPYTKERVRALKHFHTLSGSALECELS